MTSKRRQRRDFFARASLPTSAFETITVDNTVQTLSAGVYGNAQQAIIDVRSYPLRFRIDGMAATTVPDDVVGAMNHMRPCVLVVGKYTFTCVETSPGDYEFTNAVELAAGVDDLEDWHAEESAGAVIITSTGAKPEGIGLDIPAILDIGETTGGGATDPAVVAVLDAVFTTMNNGDTIQFYGHTFTMAASTSVSDQEFEDVDGFVACVDDLDNWGAAKDISDNAVITSAEDGEEWNGYTVVVTFRHITELVPPEAALGHLRSANENIELTRPEEIQRFRAIRTTGDSAFIDVTYYE